VHQLGGVVWGCALSWRVCWPFGLLSGCLSQWRNGEFVMWGWPINPWYEFTSNDYLLSPIQIRTSEIERMGKVDMVITRILFFSRTSTNVHIFCPAAGLRISRISSVPQHKGKQKGVTIR
jgi:hypothetical protein